MPHVNLSGTKDSGSGAKLVRISGIAPHISANFVVQHRPALFNMYLAVLHSLPSGFYYMHNRGRKPPKFGAWQSRIPAANEGLEGFYRACENPASVICR